MPHTRRLALVLSLVSFVAFSSWELLRPARTPLMDLSNTFSDHFSHMNAGRLFLRVGLDVWRKPLVEMLPPPTPQQAANLPPVARWCRDCAFIVPGWEKPVLQSWPTVVRFYPPGDMVLTAPIAALYHFTDLSATDANRLLLVLILACAHLGLFLLLDGLFAAPDGLRWHALLPGFYGVTVVLHWSLEGFYDVSMVAPLLLCWRWLGQRRGLAAAVAFCAAAFLHFRAYYYAPWFLAAIVLIVRERQWRTWARRDVAALGAGALMGAASLGSYLLAVPGLLSFSTYPSPLFIGHGHFDGEALGMAALVTLLAIAAFALSHSLLDALLVPWIALILITVRQTMPWYMVAVVPWLCAVPRPGKAERAPLVLDARLLLFLFLAAVVHPDQRIGTDLMPTWLAKLFA